MIPFSRLLLSFDNLCLVILFNDAYAKKDILVIAGKGHELTQEIKGKKYEFDERKIVREIIENLK